MTGAVNLRCEYRIHPLGIDVTLPRLSWQMESKAQGARQTAYRLRAATTPDLLSTDAPDLWDSSKVDSDQSVQVVYSGKTLASRQRVYWNVTLWDESGEAATSAPSWFELGLLKRRDWKAKWIGASLYGGPRSLFPAPYLRKSFMLPAPPVSARLYVTALGLYECRINGSRVGDDVLSPGWTDYRKRVRYSVYDVTPLLKQGENVIGVILGDGWAVGHTSWNHRQFYADRPQLFAQLEITTETGSRIIISTDRTWKVQFGSILHNDLLMGEAYDARREIPGWDSPSFDDGGWSRVEVFESPDITLVAANAPAMHRIDEIKPVGKPAEKGRTNHKRYIFDMGQNMVGRVRFKGSAPAGTTVTLRFAEVLNPDGSLYLDNLRSATATDYYTFKGESQETWEPLFTFHGFRYVEVSGYPGEAQPDMITGVVIHSEMTPTGTFECSDASLNQLQHNIVWGQKGNFLDVPTDCPQRDERLGWTGDIQVFLRTAAFNMDVAAFMTKWLQDLLDGQREDGAVPAVAPLVPGVPEDGGPAWADAMVICPWTLYLCYGDKRILEKTYSGMSRFMDFLIRTSERFIRCAPGYEEWPGFGDWLSINALTPRDLIGTAFFAYDAHLMSRIAEVLGKPRDAGRYRALFKNVKKAFARRYLVGSRVKAERERPSEARKLADDADAISQGNLRAVNFGKIESAVFNTALFNPSQTAYVLALHFDLLPEELRPLAAAELVTDIARRGVHLSTGFVGASYLPFTLSQNKQLGVAYSLLYQKSWPSWLYPVTQGATTIWERWDGWTEDSGFQDPGMNSFNHYAYGSIGAWLYSTVAGIEIDPSQPGFKHILLHPQPDNRLTHARGRLTTLYGEVVSDWQQTEKRFEWTVILPPNTSATAHVPGERSASIRVNGQKVTSGVLELDAGTYHIVVG